MTVETKLKEIITNIRTEREVATNWTDTQRILKNTADGLDGVILEYNEEIKSLNKKYDTLNTDLTNTTIKLNNALENQTISGEDTPTDWQAEALNYKAELDKWIKAFPNTDFKNKGITPANIRTKYNEGGKPADYDIIRNERNNWTTAFPNVDFKNKGITPAIIRTKYDNYDKGKSDLDKWTSLFPSPLTPAQVKTKYDEPKGITLTKEQQDKLDKYDTLKADKERIEGERDKARKDLADEIANSPVRKLATALKDLKEANDKIEELKRQKKQLEIDKKIIEAELATEKEELVDKKKDLNSKLSAKNEEIEILNGQIKTIKGRRAELQDDISDLQVIILKKNNEENDAIKKLRQDLKDEEDKNINLNTDIQILEAKNKKLTAWKNNFVDVDKVGLENRITRMIKEHGEETDKLNNRYERLQASIELENTQLKTYTEFNTIK